MVNAVGDRHGSYPWRLSRTTELLVPSYYRVSGTLVDKYKREPNILQSTCHNVTVGKGTIYHSILLCRYIPVRATGIMPEDTFRKVMKGPTIVQQGYDRPNDIKAKQTNFWPYSKAVTGPIIVLCWYGPMTGPIIVLHRYGPVQARATKLWQVEWHKVRKDKCLAKPNVCCCR